MGLPMENDFLATTSEQIMKPESKFGTQKNILSLTFRSVPSFILADLLENACLLVIGVFRSTLFVSVFQGSLLVIALFRVMTTSFLRSFLWSFLFLSLARIKQCLPPAFNKNSTYHRDFFAVLDHFCGHSQSCFLRAKLGECVALWVALTRPPLKWLTEQKNPLEVCKHAARYNEFGYKRLVHSFQT